MLAVAEITDPRQLAEYRLLWRSLYGRTPNASFVQTREWLECYCRRYGHEDRLRTLVVMAVGRPIGIVPLVIRPVPTRLGIMRALTYPLRDRAAFMGPVGPNPTATLFGALKHLAVAPRDWELIDLRSIDAWRADRGRTANAFRLAGLPARARSWSPVSIVSCAELDVARQFRLRNDLHQAERELTRCGRWEIMSSTAESFAGEPARLWELIAPLLADRGEAEANFLLDCFLTAHDLELGSLKVLRLNGVIAGWILTTCNGETLEPLAAEFTGEQAARVRRVLVGRMLVAGIDAGCARAVFGPRHLALADDWQPLRTESLRWTHFARFGARAQLLRWGQRRTPILLPPTVATA